MTPESAGDAVASLVVAVASLVVAVASLVMAMASPPERYQMPERGSQIRGCPSRMRKPH